MRNYIVKIICCLSILGMAGCMKEIAPEPIESSELSEYIQFTTRIGGMTKSTVTKTYNLGYLVAEESPWLDFDGTQTKADAMMQLSGDVALTMFAYDAWSETAESWAANTNAKYQFDGNTLAGKMVRWSSIGNKEKLRVFACAPYFKSAVQNDVVVGTPKISFSPDSDVKKQVDLVASMAEVSVDEDRYERVALGFEHVLTGIRFRAGFDCTLNWISIEGVNTKADYLIGTGWTNLSESGSYRIEYNKTFNAGYNITGAGETLMLIPQTLGDGAKVVMNYTVGSEIKELSSSLTGITWEPGKMITYTLYDKATSGEVIYFDLAAGNVQIGPGENSSNTSANGYSGYVFKGGEKTMVSGDHNSSNIYYVYQTAEDNSGDSSIPKYSSITYDGKAWTDYIENNPAVGKVITAWKSAAEAAGREPTTNRIRVHGSSIDVNLTIDNIYSTYAQRNVGRTTAAIGFNSGTNSTLRITMVGDNRVSAVHYHAKEEYNSEIIFEGLGSLTVAAASGSTDFYNTTYIGETESNDTTFVDNHWCSAIGGNDSSEGNSCGIIFNSGNIYAGTTKAEQCSAIGGGGNDKGFITINGGTVTAVATTTGTAIGGGIGYNAAGGVGKVTINGGNVYAYNHANRWDIPSSAIGGAGSSASTGTIGTVTINGGNVYAQSALGTAIGGGSSKTQKGGPGVVTITGGNIIARSVGAYSGGGTSGEWIDAGAGIGGGTGCSGGSETSDASGGNATIKISGNPVILTGSIGGGRTGAKKGNIGTATIDIHGGDIQAQFVMAGSVLEGSAFTPPSFNMTAGLIRTSKYNDSQYFHIKENGGAVYMEDGSFTMTGGMIMDCYAKKGGAIYIKKGTMTVTPPSFKMSGGEIAKCYSETDGGAVYLEDGTVEVSGSAKIRSCYTGEGGKGGAICINKTGTLSPSFTMTGGEISKNVAVSLGGALHLEGGSVTISNGTISGNLVENGNGGAISINSGSFLMDKVSQGNGATIFANSAISQTDNTGYGGGVYITTGGQDVDVDILAGSIIGNSSTRHGGGICVDLPSDEVTATVTVGETGSNNLEYPNITSNITLLSGGGLYVNGRQASVVINSGKIQDNSTVGYVDNPDIMNETGMVTLNGGDVKSVNVIYKGNKGDSINGEDIGAVEYTQRIVTDTNNKLAAPTFYRNGYKFVCWNTREDGLGVDNYYDGQTVKRSSDLILYAIWELN